MKFGVLQLFIEIFFESFTGLIAGDSKLLVIKWIPKNRGTVTANLALVVPQIHYDRSGAGHRSVHGQNQHLGLQAIVLKPCEVFPQGTAGNAAFRERFARVGGGGPSAI